MKCKNIILFAGVIVLSFQGASFLRAEDEGGRCGGHSEDIHCGSSSERQYTDESRN